MSNTTPFGIPIPAARKISPLRQRMIDDMTVRNFAPNTVVNYLKQVSYFAGHFGRSPERLGPEQIRSYQIYLAKEKRASVSTCTVAVSALRFLYRVTLKQDWVVEMIPTPKKEYRLPVILSPEEVLRLLEAAPSFSHRVIFSTMYGTGVRVSEALHLRVPYIDSQRMMIRIQQGKGHKDRYVQLSPKLLELLRTYWRTVRPQEWLFPGQVPNQPLGREAVGPQPALLTTRLRRASAGGRGQPAQNSTSPRSPQSGHHGPLPLSGHPYDLRHDQPIGSASLSRP
jgi:integrase/recombinase XerD